MVSTESSTINSWLVLAIVSLNAGLNTYLYPVGSKLQWIFLFWTVVGMPLGAFIGVKYEGLALGFSVFVNVASIWLRWVCVHTKIFQLCSVSMLINAAATWPIRSLPARVSQRFCQDQRVLTTSIAVQASYLGRLLGVDLPPQFKGPERFIGLCLWQAIIISPLVVLMLACYRPMTRTEQDSQDLPAPTPGESAGRADSVDGSFCRLYQACRQNPMYLLQVLACGILGAVSLAQPQTTVFILQSHGFENKNNVTFWVHLCFIGAGVISGLVIGKTCTSAAKFGVVLKCLFLGCTVCNLLCAMFTASGFVGPDNSTSFFIMMVLSAGVGMTSLGFIGVAIEAAALHPVGAGYACWFVQILVHALGGALGLVVFQDEQGFTKLAVVTVLATILIFLCYREPPPKTGLMA